MRINTNLTALNTFTQYTKNNNKIASSVEKLSSGNAINSAADNAAGLAISEKMRAQIRGLDKASSNSQDAISLVQTAEGSLNESNEILQRMRELSVQSASDTNEDKIDREALQDEFSQLQSELNDIASNTTFNKKNLLDGSLAASNKNLKTTDLKNSGMTIELGNVKTGNYNFSVSTKLESAAVEGVQPQSIELVTDGAESYFDNTAATDNKAELTDVTKAAASSLLNGNYDLSAEYGDDGCITVTAKGDNDQQFTAKISQEDLAALDTATDADRKLEITFNAEASDAFTVSLGLKDKITPTKNNYDTLAENISKLSVSVSGGVTAKEAEYGVYANLTGAESVKLEAGMSSASFSNGVKVNFDTLTTSSVDTKNNATLAVGSSGTIADNMSNITLTLADDINAGTSGATGANLAVTDANNAMSYGEFDVGVVEDTDNAGEYFMTLTDSEGNVFTSTTHVETTAEEGATTAVVSLNTFNDSDGVAVAGLSAKLTYTSASFAAADVGLQSDAAAKGTSSIVKTGASASLGGFTFTDDSVVANGSLNISVAKDAGDTNYIFTATDSAGTTYTSTIAKSALDASAASTAKTNTLNFTTKNGLAGFSATLTTTNDASDNAVTFSDGKVMSDTISKAGHNYTKIFGEGTDSNLAVTTASSFSVEETNGQGLTFQVGANEGDEMTIYIDKMDTNYLGVASADISTREGASKAITAVDDAINQVSAQRAYLGAIQNRLDHKIANLNTSSENLTSAESQIRDVDMAKEMTEFTNSGILQQASISMLAQANSQPQSVLKLLG